MKLQIEDGQKSYFYDVLLCLAIYLVVSSCPAPFFLDQGSFTCILRLLVTIPIFGLLCTHASPKLVKSTKGFLLCLPFFILCFGNLCSLFFAKELTPNKEDLFLQGFFSLVTAGIEEVIFRFGVCEILSKTNLRKFRILISAFLFGAFHLLSLIAGSPVIPTLAQAGYTFLLGLLLGLVYETGGLGIAILLHFAFNFFQNDLFTKLGGGEWNAIFFAFNIGFYLLCVGYAFVFKAVFFNGLLEKETAHKI